MKQKRISAYIVGGFTVALTLVIAVFLAMIIGGLIFPRQTKLVIRTGSAEQVYNGEALTNDFYEIVLGELRDGDELTIGFTGNQTLVGTSENTATVEIRDANGAVVTKRYAVEFEHGDLTVLPRKIYVSSESAEMIYNGSALTAEKCGVITGEPIEGHRLTLKTTGTQTIVGKSLNHMQAIVYDNGGNDVTAQYEIVYSLGTLTVTPRKITIKSASATKNYDGTPLSTSDWSFEAGSLCEGQQIEVKTSGTQTAVGSSENVIVYVLIYETQNGVQRDVSGNYEIACYYGELNVRPPKK